MGIGQRIKAISRDKGFTLRQLAEKAGVSYNTIYSITKRDSERIQGNILQRISLALEVSPSELIGSGGEPFDSVFGLIVDEYPKATFSPGDKNSVRLSLGVNYRDRLLKYFDLLNDDGQQKVVAFSEDLAGNPKYKRTTPQEAPETPPPVTDTTPEEKPPTGP